MSALLVPATQESPLRTPRRKRTRTEARESVELQSPQPQAGPSRSSRHGSVNGRNLRDEGSDDERRRERMPEQGLDIDTFDMKPIENSRPNLNAVCCRRRTSSHMRSLNTIFRCFRSRLSEGCWMRIFRRTKFKSK
jgi:hypothetical protein